MAEVYERGQVVIPKYIRTMLRLTPGRKVNFRVEGTKLVMETETVDAWLEELKHIRSTAIMSHREVMESIEKTEKKRRKEMLHVPGL